MADIRTRSDDIAKTNWTELGAVSSLQTQHGLTAVTMPTDHRAKTVALSSIITTATGAIAVLLKFGSELGKGRFVCALRTADSV